MRNSPLVRISRSGSCMSGAYRWRRNSSSLSPSKLRAAAVVERDEEGDPLVAGGLLLGPVHAPHEVGRQPLAAADEPHPDALLVQFGRLLVDPSREHLHEPVDLGLRARPVLGGERV